MLRTVSVSDGDREAFCSLPGGMPLLATALDGDEHLLTFDGSEAQARCSLWWRATPSLDGRRLGYIGHFAATNAGCAQHLLDQACRSLTAHGCQLAVGPIDGSTWKRYRLLTERGDEPPFFLEPDNPDDWPSYFSAADFQKLAHYTSAMTHDLQTPDPQVAETAERMRELGVHLRQMDPQAFSDEVDRIFDISAVSFQKSFLYSPIERSECAALYEPLKQYIRPELVLIAQRQETPVGFIFALPDWLQAQRGAPVDTVVVKSIAILPQREYAGLGRLLFARCHERIAQLGYKRAVHALMHDDNKGSRRLSDRFAKTIRGYTLFARSLDR